MGKIYTIQPVEVELSYDVLPTTIASVKIQYINPDKVEGEFTAALDTVNKKVKYTGLPTQSYEDFAVKANGTWKFIILFIGTDGSTTPGEPVTVTIYQKFK